MAFSVTMTEVILTEDFSFAQRATIAELLTWKTDEKALQSYDILCSLAAFK